MSACTAIALYVPPQLPAIVEPQIINPCDCGQESDYGVHGTKDGEVISKYYCTKCYNLLKRSQES